ncbi:MAG: lipoate--protein ligase family protein [Planctomycetes bacterium]|nr:lipoate--protein ligase family protein [Planctomycetota bacterium]
MRLLDLTLNSPAENIALDEALLTAAEDAGRPWEVLRLWEPATPMVVVGRASQVDVEVRRDECLRRGIPIFRRASGGAAIVTGPGCLMYAVVLSYDHGPHLRMIEQAHQFVLERIAASLRATHPHVVRRGTSDLAIGDCKISGNSMRAGRTHMLYHGTLLYDFSLDLIETCLKTPPRQPDYREGRRHGDFVANLNVPAAALRAALTAAWDAGELLADWPRAATRRLVEERYCRDDWNFRR